MACLRKIMGVTRLDKIRNQKIRETLGHNRTVLDIIRDRRLKYFGHIIRMGNERFPKIALEGRTHGTRPRGRPPKKWTNCLRDDCSARNVDRLTDATHLASNRSAWQDIVRQKPSHS